MQKAAPESGFFLCLEALLEDSFWLHERFAIDFYVFIQDNRKIF